MDENINSNKKIIIGTSGFSYSDWIGTFYPSGLSSNEFLKYYSTHFDGVELNYTYYSLPKPQNLEKMIFQTPSDFIFSVKAHKSFTHERDNTFSYVKEFLEAIKPLKESNKLATVLLQFPYSFHYTKQNRYLLARLLDQFNNIPLAVEFRNREWQRNSVFQELSDRNISYVNVDLPTLINLPLPTSITTSKIGYIRFHGRNSANWWEGNNTTRYDYQYKEEELKKWITPIRKMLNKVSLLLIFFNNHHQAKAVQNAKKLKEMFTSY